MIGGTYAVIELKNEVTAEFGISYSNQMLSSYVLFRKHGRYISLLDITKTSLKDSPEESELMRASEILDQAEKIKADKAYGRKIAGKYYK